MGEVYRAHDARLGRNVALKVLPADFATDPERRRRFEQEARAASGLNHPNVVPVYDVGGDDGTIFIAMELVEGRTLREIVSAGPLPLKKFLDIAIQIADGLARAHEAGIVHRDLKPENVMVSKDGLDFRQGAISRSLGKYDRYRRESRVRSVRPAMAAWAPI